MTFKQIEAFYWAAHCSNFRSAADLVHISLSSLSQRISELEVSLNVQLFSRDGYRAQLTAQGEALLPLARDILDRMTQIKETIGVAQEIKGRCRFGIGELGSLTWLPLFLNEARKRFPQLDIAPTVEVGAELERKLERGELDCAVIAGYSDNPKIQGGRVGAADFCWVRSPALPEHDFASAASMIAAYPLITLPPSAGTFNIIRDWLARLDGRLPNILYCNNWGAIAGLISEGVGIGMLPLSWANSLTQRGELLIVNHLPPLKSLEYSVRKRVDDYRQTTDAAMQLVKDCVDFSIPHRLFK